jgi:hypothetical protein
LGKEHGAELAGPKERYVDGVPVSVRACNRFYQPALIIMHWPSPGGRWT